MRIAAAIVVLFCARFVIAAWYYPGHDGDIAWQNWLGSQVLAHHHIPDRLGAETFTAPGAHWLPQEWVFSTAVASALHSKHFPLLAIFTTLAAVGALLLTAWRARRRGASTVAVAIVTACTGFAFAESFGVRAQVFGWLCLSILMLLLDSEGPWIFLGIPVVAIWANLHASAMVAPVFVAAWTFGTIVEDRGWTPRVERNVVLTVGTFLAVFLTPFSWKLPQYAVHLETSAFRQTIAEWQPSDISFIGFWAGVLPLIGACLYFGIAAPRERWRDGMLFVVSSVMAFVAVRHMPLCALIIAPMAAARLTAALPEHARVNALLRERFSESLVYVSTAIAAVLIGLTLSHTPAIAGVTLPRAAVERLAHAPGMHNLYCEDFAWCSLALNERNIRTFIDGRCDPFPPGVWNQYLAVQRVTPVWSKVLDRDGVNSVLARRGYPLAQAMAARAGWHMFFRDHRYVLYLRNDKALARAN